MTLPLRTLLAGIFDYAGLFPPAALSMEEAVREYLEQSNGEGQLLVNRFVCPVDRLGEFWTHAEEFGSQDAPWTLTVLGTSLTDFEADLAQIESFEEVGTGRVYVEGYEVKANPTDVKPAALRALCDAPIDEIYLELPWTEDALECLDAVANTGTIGAKGRTGGADAGAYPSPSAVAAFMRECIDLDVPMKLTAGLHHPIRRKHPTFDAHEHGFLNVLIAGLLADSTDLNRTEMEKILSAQGPGQFHFEDLAIGFGDWQVGQEAVESFRGIFSSIGSCSIQEPVDDLRKLGLW